MSDEFDLDRLASLSEEVGEAVTAVKRAIVDDADGVELFELAKDLWEVLEEVGELLETIDLTEIPDAIDFEKLPDAVEVDDVPEGLLDEDESAIELTNVREAVNLRELWDAVDLTELVQEKRELDAAVDDVTDDDGEDDDDDGLIGDDDDDGWLDDDEDEADEEDDGMFQNVVDTGDGAKMQFESEARQAYLEEKILEAVEKFREALLTAHEKMRKLYHANQEKLGNPGRQPDSLNPTATSTMPPGPIPDSVSARTSTVPSQVRYSRVENPRRIYGRRFEEETDLDSRFGSDGADDSSEDEDAVEDEEAVEDEDPSDEESVETADDGDDGSEEVADGSTGSADGEQDDAETIEIGVYEGDD